MYHLIKVPSILTKIENYLYNDQLNDNSVNSLIKLLKEEWLKYELIFYELDFIILTIIIFIVSLVKQKFFINLLRVRQ
jgi:hypothetical protein